MNEFIFNRDRKEFIAGEFDVFDFPIPIRHQNVADFSGQMRLNQGEGLIQTFAVEDGPQEHMQRNSMRLVRFDSHEIQTNTNTAMIHSYFADHTGLGHGYNPMAVFFFNIKNHRQFFHFTIPIPVLSHQSLFFEGQGGTFHWVEI